MIAQAYLQIRSYPHWTAITHVIVNLIRHTDRDARRHRERVCRLAPVTDTVPIARSSREVGHRLVAASRPVGANDDLRDLDEVLCEAVRAGRITRREGEIATRAGLFGQTQTEIAAAVGISDRQVRRDLARIEPELRRVAAPLEVAA